MTMKVLIADDHEIVREGLTRLINRQSDMSVIGYAENGLDAFFKTKSLEPDIVIMDTGMPVLSGLDALPLIHDASPQTKIIIFSLNKNDEYVHKSFTAGALGYVLKLAPSQDVIDSIRAAERGERFISPVIHKRVYEKYIHNIACADEKCPYDLLSNDEQQIFRMLVQGCRYEIIARETFRTEIQVEQCHMDISKKIGISDLHEMIKYAEQIGVLTPEPWNG